MFYSQCGRSRTGELSFWNVFILLSLCSALYLMRIIFLTIFTQTDDDPSACASWPAPFSARPLYFPSFFLPFSSSTLNLQKCAYFLTKRFEREPRTSAGAPDERERGEKMMQLCRKSVSLYRAAVSAPRRGKGGRAEFKRASFVCGFVFTLNAAPGGAPLEKHVSLNTKRGLSSDRAVSGDVIWSCDLDSATLWLVKAVLTIKHDKPTAPGSEPQTKRFFS